MCVQIIEQKYSSYYLFGKDLLNRLVACDFIVCYDMFVRLFP